MNILVIVDGNVSVIVVLSYHLKSGSIKSCGCYQHDYKTKYLDGQIFGRFTVIERSVKNKLCWRCRIAGDRIIGER